MLPYLYNHGQTVYYIGEVGNIMSGKVEFRGKTKEQFFDREGNQISQLLVNNFYHLQEMGKTKFFEGQLKDSPEAFL